MIFFLLYIQSILSNDEFKSQEVKNHDLNKQENSKFYWNPLRAASAGITRLSGKKLKHVSDLDDLDRVFRKSKTSRIIIMNLKKWLRQNRKPKTISKMIKILKKCKNDIAECCSNKEEENGHNCEYGCFTFFYKIPRQFAYFYYRNVVFQSLNYLKFNSDFTCQDFKTIEKSNFLWLITLKSDIDKLDLSKQANSFGEIDFDLTVPVLDISLTLKESDGVKQLNNYYKDLLLLEMPDNNLSISLVEFQISTKKTNKKSETMTMPIAAIITFFKMATDNRYQLQNFIQQTYYLTLNKAVLLNSEINVLGTKYPSHLALKLDSKEIIKDLELLRTEIRYTGNIFFRLLKRRLYKFNINSTVLSNKTRIKLQTLDWAFTIKFPAKKKEYSTIIGILKTGNQTFDKIIIDKYMNSKGTSVVSLISSQKGNFEKNKQARNFKEKTIEIQQALLQNLVLEDLSEYPNLKKAVTNEKQSLNFSSSNQFIDEWCRYETKKIQEKYGKKFAEVEEIFIDGTKINLNDLDNLLFFKYDVETKQYISEQGMSSISSNRNKRSLINMTVNRKAIEMLSDSKNPVARLDNIFNTKENTLKAKKINKNILKATQAKRVRPGSINLNVLSGAKIIDQTIPVVGATGTELHITTNYLN